MLSLRIVNYREGERGREKTHDRKEIDNGRRYNDLADKHP